MRFHRSVTYFSTDPACLLKFWLSHSEFKKQALAPKSHTTLDELSVLEIPSKATRQSKPFF
ncbi:MAG TPA: hypothetical protein DDW73_10060 [Rhizobium sp.]|jgi:hypothetical protein|nr:hypothetical protein [Rhizobium sp.]